LNSSNLIVGDYCILPNIQIECLQSSNIALLNPFQSNFSANHILHSSYLFWAVKRLVDYL
jgi:hypothetical protein